jgi:hypothetical protein
MEWRKLMVRDEKITRTVSRVLQRSERQEGMQKLLGTFVDVGVLPQLDNQNHQILYGRRGTGKTHVFKVLDSQLREEGNIVIYVDARTLGSTAQYSDSSDIYTLDYGTYVDLMGTSQQPTLDFLEPGSESDLVVQFDDKRSIRRIVLSEEVLS